MKRRFASTIVLFVVACLAGLSHAAPIGGVTYVYDNLGDLNAVAGKDAPDGAAQALTDGLGQAGVYTPSGFFWEPGQEGTIYLEDDANILAGQAQPSVTFDLGAVFNLGDLVIHYGERTGSGIVSPLSVDVTVGAVFVDNFGGFDTSDSVENFGDIRSNTISLAGQSGQFVTLDFKGDVFPGVATTWLGLTEIEFNADPIPEPSALLLAACGLLGLLCHRWRRGRK
ncbi:MAG: hypothetical protein IIA67_02450 [Planctomycetes bacterium]|nr:hypothetical protein [Planctomycetota bacterium]